MTEIERLTAARDALLPDQGEAPKPGFAAAQQALNEALKGALAGQSGQGVGDRLQTGGVGL